MKTIAINKKASFNFNISEKIEVGLVLTGSEVRSLRLNSASIKESYISEKKSELWLNNCHISNYEKSSQKTFEPFFKAKKVAFIANLFGKQTKTMSVFTFLIIFLTAGLF